MKSQQPRGCTLSVEDEKLLYFTLVRREGTFKIEEQHFTVRGKFTNL
jgi:hypothetical protein